MDKECKKGYHWCPIEKKCIKTDNKKQGKGQQFGQGKGPIGIPKKKIIEGLNYVMETEASKEQVKKWWKDHDNMKQKSIDHAKSRDKLKTRMAMNKKQRGHYENDPKSNPYTKSPSSERSSYGDNSDKPYKKKKDILHKPDNTAKAVYGKQGTRDTSSSARVAFDRYKRTSDKQKQPTYDKDWVKNKAKEWWGKKKKAMIKKGNG